MSQTNNKPRKITVAEMAPHVHTFLPKENKTDKITKWLADWIKKSLKEGKIKPEDFLPAKGELACHTGVSIGTMQNVFRQVEDMGLIESRQKIGSCIKNPDKQPTEKLTSKREVACEVVKSHIKEHKYKTGDKLLSIKKLSDISGISATTIRIALNCLTTEGVLIKSSNNFIVSNLKFSVRTSQIQTLSDKIAEHINTYIKTNLKRGDKLPSSTALADMYGVSVKTIHDAIFILSQADIVKTKRGYYGTIVTNGKEDDSLYFYEQVQLKIKKYIAENCKVNDKLPTIKEFSEVFNVSKKTIKNALDTLAYDGYITYAHGRNGGTFVTNIPSDYNQGYTWLALSSDFEQSN